MVEVQRQRFDDFRTEPKNRHDLVVRKVFFIFSIFRFVAKVGNLLVSPEEAALEELSFHQSSRITFAEKEETRIKRALKRMSEKLHG